MVWMASPASAKWCLLDFIARVCCISLLISCPFLAMSQTCAFRYTEIFFLSKAELALGSQTISNPSADLPLMPVSVAGWEWHHWTRKLPSDRFRDAAEVSWSFPFLTVQPVVDDMIWKLNVLFSILHDSGIMHWSFIKHVGTLHRKKLTDAKEAKIVNYGCFCNFQNNWHHAHLQTDLQTCYQSACYPQLTFTNLYIFADLHWKLSFSIIGLAVSMMFAILSLIFAGIKRFVYLTYTGLIWSLETSPLWVLF